MGHPAGLFFFQALAVGGGLWVPMTLSGCTLWLKNA